MKPWILKIGGLGLLLAALSLTVGDLAHSQSNPGPSATNALPATTPPVAAPGNSSAALPPNTIPSAPLADVIKLAQTGVSEEVLLAFVNSADSSFNLGSQEIIYLNDLGVPDSVVKAMLQRDQALAAPASPMPVAPSIPASPPATQTAYAQPEPETNYDVTPPPAMEPPLPPMDLSAGAVAPPPDLQPADLSNDDFYDALAPYGSWQDVDGYGWCWQPTVVAINGAWQPYCDRGRWLYTDCGWYWHSDYTWGSVAFHYGRWFHDPRRGWCWWPDRTWGPGWVSWRYDDLYCGWAALPPSAHFTPGYGLSIGVHAAAGLDDSSFTFVPWGSLTDAHLSRHRLPEVRAAAIFDNTTALNDIASADNTVVDRGIAPEQVARITHREVPRFNIRDARHGLGEYFGNDGHTLVVNSPVNPEIRIQPATATSTAIAPAASQTVVTTANNRIAGSYTIYAARDTGGQAGLAGRAPGQPLIVRGNYTPQAAAMVAARNGGVTVIGQSFAPPHNGNPYVTYSTGGERYEAPRTYASQYSQYSQARYYPSQAPIYTPSYNAPAPRYQGYESRAGSYSEPRVPSYSPPRQESSPRVAYSGGSNRGGNGYNR